MSKLWSVARRMDGLWILSGKLGYKGIANTCSIQKFNSFCYLSFKKTNRDSNFQLPFNKSVAYTLDKATASRVPKFPLFLSMVPSHCHQLHPKLPILLAAIRLTR